MNQDQPHPWLFCAVALFALSACAAPTSPTPARVGPAAPPMLAPPPPVSPAPPRVEPRDVSLVEAARITEQFYRAVTGKSVHVVSVRPDSHLYRVLYVRDGDLAAGVQVTYLTRDGKHLVGERIDVASRKREIINDRRFAQCLLRRRVRVVGQRGDPATNEQLGRLGRFGSAVLVECTSGKYDCEAMGIKALPTTVAGDRAFEGMRTRAWMETISGCK